VFREEKGRGGDRAGLPALRGSHASAEPTAAGSDVPPIFRFSFVLMTSRIGGITLATPLAAPRRCRSRSKEEGGGNQAEARRDSARRSSNFHPRNLAVRDHNAYRRIVGYLRRLIESNLVPVIPGPYVKRDDGGLPHAQIIALPTTRRRDLRIVSQVLPPPPSPRCLASSLLSSLLLVRPTAGKCCFAALTFPARPTSLHLASSRMSGCFSPSRESDKIIHPILSARAPLPPRCLDLFA